MNKSAQIVYDFLADEGYRPKYDEEGDIVFKSEGDSYLVCFKENFPGYISLTKLFSTEFSNDKILDVYELCNQINSDYIVGKCVIRDGGETLSIEIDTLAPPENFNNYFNDYLRISQAMEEKFFEEYNEIKSR